MRRIQKASVPSYSPIFLEDVKIHICFRVFKEQSDNGSIHKTYWHKIEKYVFFLQTREVNICSIPSVQHILSLSLKLAILLFVRHNIRIFDFSTFHNIMSFLFDMIFFWIFKQIFSSTVNHFMYVQHLVTTTPFFFSNAQQKLWVSALLLYTSAWR